MPFKLAHIHEHRSMFNVFVLFFVFYFDAAVVQKHPITFQLNYIQYKRNILQFYEDIFIYS